MAEGNSPIIEGQFRVIEDKPAGNPANKQEEVPKGKSVGFMQKLFGRGKDQAPRHPSVPESSIGQSPQNTHMDKLNKRFDDLTQKTDRVMGRMQREVGASEQKSRDAFSQLVTPTQQELDQEADIQRELDEMEKRLRPKK